MKAWGNAPKLKGHIQLATMALLAAPNRPLLVSLGLHGFPGLLLVIVRAISRRANHPYGCFAPIVVPARESARHRVGARVLTEHRGG